MSIPRRPAPLPSPGPAHLQSRLKARGIGGARDARPALERFARSLEPIMPLLRSIDRLRGKTGLAHRLGRDLRIDVDLSGLGVYNARSGRTICAFMS